MRIRALIEADFNDADHKSSPLKVGDELETGDDYGAHVVALGLAEPVLPEPESEEADPEPVPQPPAKQTRKGKST